MVEDKVNKYSKTHIKSDFVILQDKDGSDWQAMLVAIQIAPRACCGKSPKPPLNTDFQSVAARSGERF